MSEWRCMMLLDEMLLTGGGMQPHVRQSLAHAVAFNIDNVALYYRAVSREDAYRDLRQDVPNAAPLGTICWFEWSRGFDCIGTVTNHGVLVTVLSDRTDPEWQPPTELNMPASARWALGFSHILRSAGDLQSVTALIVIFVGPDGALIDVGSIAEPDLSEREMDKMLSWSAVALHAMCFAHCKNVHIVDQKPSRQMLRAAERTGKPTITFKTLDIDPVKKVLRDEGGVETHGLACAMHICRGHFAHYTEDKPLFGRFTGTFYRPMHTRGSLKAGVVIKDYNVLSSDPS